MSGKGLAYAAIYGATVTLVAYLLAQGNVVGFTAILFGLSLAATFIEWRRLRRNPHRRRHKSDGSANGPTDERT
jgi:hypothetical protein